MKVQNITKKNRKTQRNIIRDKMANLGLLAGNIAHEINNPLEAIQNRVGRLLLENVRKSEIAFLRHELEKIQEQVYRISITTNALSALSQESTQHFKLVDIHSIIMRSIDLCRFTNSKPKIQFETDFADIPKVMGSEIDLEHCFLNIFTNSIEAINGKGIISIKTKKYGKGGEYVRITIADSGEGIPAEILHQVAEPFFTTKNHNHKGLGLSICYGIIANHGGMLDIMSEGREGTIILLSIPNGELESKREE